MNENVEPAENEVSEVEEQPTQVVDLSIELLKKAAESEKKAADYYDQLLRLKAEFDNFRRRTEKEKVEAKAWGKQEVIAPLISLVDVFEQALSQAKSAQNMDQVIIGLEFLHKGFQGFLKAEGVEALDLVGKNFDPHEAEAVEQVEVDESSVDHVLAELQKGYKFQGKILRPGRVRVGVAKKSDASAE